MGVEAMDTQVPLRILAFVEAATVTGPVKNLIEFSRAAGDRVALSMATFVRGGAGDSEFSAAVRDAGIPLLRIAERSALDPRVIGRMRDLVAESRPDILQTHSVKSHFLLYLSGLWKARPWVVFHHGYTTTNAKMRLYNQLDRISLGAAKRLVTVSHAFERQLTGRGLARSRVTVVHNAVDACWAERVRSMDRALARREIGVGPEEPVILAVGRMSQEKGHIDLIHAFDKLRAKGIRARLVLAGDGPERNALERAAGAGVLFRGQVRDTVPYYAAASVMALPSLSEGSPNVLLESMAVDVPVVATDRGGIPEIVRHRESALLVPARNPVALAGALEELLSDGRLGASLAARARTIIAEKHSPEARARTLLDLYTGVARRQEDPSTHVVTG